MKVFIFRLIIFLSPSLCLAQNIHQIVKKQDVERIVRTLAADDMQGRKAFTPGAEKAASFIETEFKKIGLLPLRNEESFRQTFRINHIKPIATAISINGSAIDKDKAVVISDKANLDWNTNPDIEINIIKAGENLFSHYQQLIKVNKQSLVLVDESLANQFKKLKNYYDNDRLVEKPNEELSAVFILGISEVKSFRVNFSNQIENMPLFNIAGMLPGKSKEKEVVIFSGHYDHLGVVKPIAADSIANGADDDASGIAAVISLAKYYKKLNNNERTLIFVAFTAEEIGGLGSEYFSQQLNPDDVTAMFNIEMIGKDSKFGKNTAFITGYEKSDFGEILQRNLKGTAFKFYPDPYPDQNLFYRSDNATLAALGVPAHTISTDQIDKDEFYHSVNDEFETLDVDNITSTIKAIALSSRSIVAGKDTPKRIAKLEH